MVNCVHKEMDMVQIVYGIQTMIDWYLVPKMCQENIPHTTPTSLDCWHKAAWFHGFMLLMPNSDYHLQPQPKSIFIRLHFFPHFSTVWSLCPVQPPISVSWRTGVEPDVVVRHRRPSAFGFDVFAFRDTFLLGTVVKKSGDLSSCSLSVSLNQSGCSPLTSLIDRVFICRTGAHWTCLCLLPFSVKSCLTAAIMRWSKYRSHISPLMLMFDVTINWSSWPVSAWFNATLPHDWLIG